MKYCSHCASLLTIKIPADDSRERHVCEACGSIHYQNPRNVVGSIPVYEKQVLLCRRAIEPRHGYFWPYMRNVGIPIGVQIRADKF